MSWALLGWTNSSRVSEWVSGEMIIHRSIKKKKKNGKSTSKKVININKVTQIVIYSTSPFSPKYIYIFFIYTLLKGSCNFPRLNFSWPFLLYPMQSMGESVVIGLAASSTSKGPQAKTTEPMVSIKVPNCSIQLGWNLARDGCAKNCMESRPEAKKCQFFT